MRRWNSFQKDLLVISILSLLHLVFTLNFPLRGLEGESVSVTRNLVTFNFEVASTGETFTYIPILTILYVALLIGLVLIKPKPLTLIYGLGLVLVGKFSFLSQLASLETANESMVSSNPLSTTITQAGSVVVQDIAGYVLVALFFIKLAIVSYDAYKAYRKKHPKKQKPIQQKNEVPS
ncbi:MAG: hypothetical protein ACQEQA_04550 [Bacillota bacterium]